MPIGTTDIIHIVKHVPELIRHVAEIAGCALVRLQAEWVGLDLLGCPLHTHRS